MKSTILALFLTLFCQTNSFSQKESMVFKKGLWTTKYVYMGQDYTRSEAGEKFKNENPEAYAAYKKGKTAHGFATAFGFVGGFLVGWELSGRIRRTEKINYMRGGIGVGLSLIGLIFDRSANKNFQNAATIFNDGKGTSFKSLKLNLSNQNEFGLCFQF